MKEHYVIAIDGPSGAGKSTLARRLAGELGCSYVDTGAIYRTVAYHFTMLGIGPKDNDNIRRFLPDAAIEIQFPGDGLQHMILNGKDVTGEIRTPEISAVSSQISAQPLVREFLLDMQRNLAKQYSVVMDGRDIGTVVLPNADVKIFLTASAEARAQRRFAELTEKGEKTTYGAVLADQKQRDERDMTRKIAPLKKARDAVELDTTEMTIDEAAVALREIVESRCV
jgi:cytidylate kinase